MKRNDQRRDREALTQLERVADDLIGLAADPPEDFALRVLRHVGVRREQYDTYTRLETPAGGLFVAAGPHAVTGAALDSGGLTAAVFEELHRARTRRSAIRTAKPFPGVTTALRTGRTRGLPVDLSGLTASERAVLEAVRTIPSGQLRPVEWIAREAGVPAAAVTDALARNPVAVLVPSHRVTHRGGVPCDAGLAPGAGDALRAAEGIDMERMAELHRGGAVFLGSDTTRVYCHPTCAYARRIAPHHQVPFRTAHEADRAGYRACRKCRPITV
ncbi:MGMT family protein [Streptomyces sudanensis]|uniref:MGMT family protein n=1 Tax=Streptomyces sudanensis TaxID=436397 RepID=UPI0020CF5DC1|nr:MGMT family protein [Streptomyces sudanensis]MCP9958557.1 MGMT family protein [Streptomyces sudanensis]